MYTGQKKKKKKLFSVRLVAEPQSLAYIIQLTQTMLIKLITYH